MSKLNEYLDREQWNKQHPDFYLVNKKPLSLIYY